MATSSAKDKFWIRICLILGVVVSAAVAFLILGPRPEGTQGTLDVTNLPKVNASLNAATAVLLLVGLWFIKKGRITAHKNTMLTAFGTSTAFLVSYVIYHWFKDGPREYVGDLKGLYLFILLTHIVLAAVIVPLALITLYRGWTMSVEKHRKIARVTLPLWLYVSVTGVVIYGMLYL
jgi:putative membrane protein